jgi:Fe-S-cluster containining protein
LHPLFPIIDNALASAAARSGAHLACRAGCHQCCIGVFAITPLDAATLREGLALAPEETRNNILARAHASHERLLAAGFPGDPTTGALFTEPHHEALFEDFANDEPCPALSPATGTCDLYAHRPVQCRTFGPPIRDEDQNLALCELCFTNATEEEILHAEMDQTWRTLEEDANAIFPDPHPTLVAFALR